MSEAKIVLSADDKTGAAFASVTRSLQGLEHGAEAVKSALEGIGVALSIGEFVEFVHHAVEGADALGKLSQRTSISTEHLSQLQYAAKLANVNSDTLTTSIKKLNVSIAEGLSGDMAKVQLFKQLGITTADLGKGTEAVMMKIADAYAHAKDGAGKVAVGNALMGKSADEMIPFLNAGSQSIRDLMTEADKLGLTISSDFAEKADQFESNLTRIHAGSQKLAIMLGSDLVEGLGKAMQAFIEAGKEGSKFTQILVGMNVLFWGDDQHRNNVALVEDTDKLLRAEADLARLRKQGYSEESFAVITEKKNIDDINARLKTTLTYRKDLTAQAEKAKAAQEAAIAARTDGKELTVPNLAAQAEYDRIIKTIKEKIAAEDQEIALGRSLTEIEKFDIKVLTDLGVSKKALTEAQKESIKQTLREADAKAVLLQQMQQELKLAGQVAKAVFDEDAELAADAKNRVDQRNRVNQSIIDQTRALADSNEETRAELSLMGATDSQRAIALGDLKVEQDLKHKIEDLDKDLLLNEEQRAKFREQYAANAQEAKAQIAEREALKEQMTLIGDIEQEGKTLWDNLWQGGNDTFKRLGQSLKTFLIDELYKLVVKKWILNVAANVTGSSGGVAGMAGSALTGGGGGLSGLLSTGGTLLNGGSLSNAGGIVGAFSQGFSGSAAIGTGSSFASTVGGGLATDAMGAGVAEGAAAAGIETGIGAGIEAGLAAVPVVGWIALAGMALYSIFGGKGGGPKTEGGYAPGGIDISGIDIGGSVQGSQRGNVSDAKTISDAINTGLTGLGNQFGVSLAENIGVFFAKDPQGDSMTQLQVVSDNYNRSKTEGGIENVGRSDAEFQAALAKATAQLDLTELAHALTGKIGDYLKALDPASLTTDQITADLQLAANAKQLTDAFTALGPAFANVAALSVDGLNDVAKSLGGIQTATADLASYATNFYTDAEKKSLIANDIATKLSAGGLSVTADQVLNETRDQFRQLEETLVGQGNASAAEALMSVNAEFASLVPSANDAAGALSDLSGIFGGANAKVQNGTDFVTNAKAMEDFANSQRAAYGNALLGQKTQIADLKQQLLGLTDPAAALAQQRADVLRSLMSDEARTLQSEIYAQQDLQNATKSSSLQIQDMASAAMSMIQPLEDAKKGLQAFLDTLLGSGLNGLSGGASYAAARAALGNAKPDNVEALSKDFLAIAGKQDTSAAQYAQDLGYVRQMVMKAQGSLQGQATAIQVSSNNAQAALLAASMPYQPPEGYGWMSSDGSRSSPMPMGAALQSISVGISAMHQRLAAIETHARVTAASTTEHTNLWRRTTRDGNALVTTTAT